MYYDFKEWIKDLQTIKALHDTFYVIYEGCLKISLNFAHVTKIYC
jgi:hypothetical protein